MQLGELHHPHRLVVALRIRHPELPLHTLLGVAALLLADECDGSPIQLAEPGDHRPVVGPAAVAVQLEPVVEQPLDVVERVGPLVVAGELDGTPDVLVGGVLLDAIELPLEPLELTGQLRAAEEGRKTIVCTIDPAKRLAQSLGLSELDNTPRTVPAAAFKGRKPKAERKDTELRIRVTVAQKRLLADAADREALAVSSWVRKVALQTARAQH